VVLVKDREQRNHTIRVLQEIFTDLKWTAFSVLSRGEEDTSGLNETSYPCGECRPFNRPHNTSPSVITQLLIRRHMLTLQALIFQ
jgi:hypothetical protein